MTLFLVVSNYHVTNCCSFTYPGRYINKYVMYIIFAQEHPCKLLVHYCKTKSVISFKGRLDHFWNDQEVKYSWKADADIIGTGSRSNIV